MHIDESIQAAYAKQLAYLERIARNTAANRSLLLVSVPGGCHGLMSEHYVQLLQCRPSTAGQKQVIPCGVCVHCTAAQSGRHPDVFVSAPQEAPITIDDAHHIRQHLFSRPSMGAFRIALVHDAHRMNIQASNSLLKVIEDCPLHSVVVMDTAFPEILPKTIRSRMPVLILPAIRSHQSAPAEITETEKFWQTFLHSGTAERLNAVAELAENARVDEALNCIQSLLRLELKKHYAVGTAATTQSTRMNVQQILRQLESLETLRDMQAKQTNKKMILEYLTLSL